jgi:hypothetical protein
MQANGNRVQAPNGVRVLHGMGSATVECLAEVLRGLPWQSLRLEPVDDDDPAVGRLQLAMANLEIESQLLFHFVNWSHWLRDQSFERYFADRPSRLRNTVARKRRKLKREHGCEMRLYKDRHLDRALADYARVYQAIWKDGERFRDFMPALARTTAVTGWSSSWRPSRLRG